MIQEFLREMHKNIPKGSCVMYCQFRGDPNAEQRGKWRSRPLTKLSDLDDKANVYLTVSAMKQDENGRIRRRKENFAAGLLLMIDDLGDGPGAKFPLSIIDKLEPTCLIETSPDNFQAIYMFDHPVENQKTFDRLIKAFIEKEFLGGDPGMAGVNRVFRPPIGVNDKPKYGGWTVKGNSPKWSNRYSVEEIAKAFDLDMTPSRRVPHGATVSKPDNIRAFIDTRRVIRSAGMLKSEEPNADGWIDIRCPWTEEHTGGVDNGAAIREPAEENDWYGAFRCHHGHSDGKGWKELTQWLNDQIEEVLASINKNAPEWEEFDV